MSDTLTVDISALPEGVRAAAKSIAGERGAERPLSLEDLIALRDAAEMGRRAYERGEGEDSGPADAHLDAAVGIPGALLHRPTYGCHLRLMRTDSWRIPERWREWPAEWTTLVAAFVLAHAYDETACAALADEAQGIRLIEAWAETLDATPRETSLAVRRLLRDAYPPAAGTGEKKKPGRAPKPCRVSYARWWTERGETRSTGSGGSRRATCAGCSGKSTGGSGAKPKRPGTAPERPSIPETRECGPGKHGDCLCSD